MWMMAEWYLMVVASTNVSLGEKSQAAGSIDLLLLFGSLWTSGLSEMLWRIPASIMGLGNMNAKARQELSVSHHPGNCGTLKQREKNFAFSNV